MQKNQNNLEYFQSEIFKIPKEIKLEILSISQPLNTKIDKKLEGFQGKPSFFLKCSGPLGSTLVNLQKFDKFGLCFFEIKDLEENNTNIEKYLKVSIKTFKKSLNNTNTDKIPEKSAAFFELFRSLYKQTLEGITQGYVLYLELHGVGFRANFHEKKESNPQSEIGVPNIVKKFIEFKLGQSHDIFYEIPNSIQVFLIKPTVIGLYGIDKEKITQIGAQLRQLKLPDPYKGKGIRYKDEIVKTKTGKKK